MRVALIFAALLATVLAQNPASFTVAILNRDFQGCQYAPIAANWQPKCSHWSDAQPAGSNPNCVGNQNPDFEGFYPGSPYPRTIHGVVLPALDPVDLVPQFNPTGPGNTDQMFHGKHYFDQWYRDVPGVNTQVMTEAKFDWAASDPDCPAACYVWNEDFDHGPYFPIDGKGYGNYCWYGPVGNALAYPQDQVRPECLFKIDGEVNRPGPCVQHNFHFTDHLAWDFLLVPGSYIKFNGDDDTWIYIGSVLVVDLGGIDWTATFSWTGTFSEMTRLGLTAGNMYTLRWFHAQRKIDCSHHKMVTTLVPYCYAEVDGTLCGSQTGLPICQARQCVLNQCVVSAYDDTVRCPHKNGAADGMPICNAQRCVGTVCNNTLPYNDASCPARAVPSALPAQCNKWQCVGNECLLTPWYFPGTVPAYPNQSPNNPTPEKPCTDVVDHDLQCWRPYCVPDTTPQANAPYGVGVCGGQFDNTNAATCPPPQVNGKDVNPACYVPKCDPSQNGKCSAEIITGGPGADPASHLGSCPVGMDANGVTYDIRCFYPFCDQYGQCSGDVLSGMFVPFAPGVDGVYIPGWRNDSLAPTPEECGVPAQYDARCYLPACVGGHCGGWVLNGSEAWRYTGGDMTECPVPADKNSQCYDPFCVDGVCGGAAGNFSSPCIPNNDEVNPLADRNCVFYVCGDPTLGEKEGSCVWRFYGNDTHCAPGSDSFCTAFLCGSGDVSTGGDGFPQGACAQRPYNLSMTCAEEEHMCNHFECRADPAAPNSGICMEVPNSANSTCVTDDDACTNEICIVDAVTGKGMCNVTTPVTCADPLELSPPLVCRQNGVCDPATGSCVYDLVPDSTPCVPETPDQYCTNYTCWTGQCLRNCSCGNGRLDFDEDCDPNMNPWSENHHCNETCAIVHPASRGLSNGAIAGIAVGAVCGAAALAAAAVVAARAAGGAGGAPPAAAGGDPAVASSVDNPLFAASSESFSNPLFANQ